MIPKGIDNGIPADIPSEIVLVPVPGYVYPGSVAASNNTFAVNGYTYTCGASSTYGDFYAYKAFTTTTINNGWWASQGSRFSTSNGTYTGSNSLGGNTGEYIFFSFPYKILPYGYAIQGDTQARAPNNFKFIASPDNGVSWTTLDTQTNVPAENTANNNLYLYYVLLGKNVNPSNIKYNRVAIVISKIGNGTTYADITGLWRFFILGATDYTP